MSDLRVYDIARDEMRPATQADIERMQRMIGVMGRFVSAVRNVTQGARPGVDVSMAVTHALERYERERDDAVREFRDG